LDSTPAPATARTHEWSKGAPPFSATETLLVCAAHYLRLRHTADTVRPVAARNHSEGHDQDVVRGVEERREAQLTIGASPRWTDISIRRKSMSNRKRPRGRPPKYPPEFQRDAVAMVLDEGRSIVEVADAIGVRDSTLRNWVAKARRERSAEVGLSADERAELDELRAECTQLRMERDLLKRSMAFWVRELAP
jgi:transposase